MKKFLLPLLAILLLMPSIAMAPAPVTPAPSPIETVVAAPTPLPVVTLEPAPSPTPVAPSLKPKVIKHVSVTPDPDRTLFFKGEVNDKSADKFIIDLNSLDEADQSKPIFIVINSPGGSLEAGFRIENNMDALRAPTVCIVENGAYSMASGIFLHCGSRYMEPHTSLMFHYGSIAIQGSRYEAAEQMRHALDQFDQFDEDNAKHLGLTLKAYRAKIDHDWWLTETQAIQNNAADAIVDNFRVKQPPPLPPANPFDDLFKVPF